MGIIIQLGAVVLLLFRDEAPVGAAATIGCGEETPLPFTAVPDRLTSAREIHVGAPLHNLFYTPLFPP